MISFRRRGREASLTTTAAIEEALARVSPHPERVRAMGPRDSLASARVDSLGFVEMITSLEESLGIDLSPALDDLRAAATRSDLEAAVDRVRVQRRSGR